jgi:hypothetical protein
VGRSPWLSIGSDSPGQKGAVQASPALYAHYQANIFGTSGQNYINALIRLKGGTAAIPAFRADLARVTGRSDIDVWNNRENFGNAVERITRYEAACLLAFALAALVAALFLVGQSVARYTSATVADLPGLAGGGHDAAARPWRRRPQRRCWPRRPGPRSGWSRPSWPPAGCRSASRPTLSRTRASAPTG